MTSNETPDLLSIVTARATAPVVPEVRALGDALHAKFGNAAEAVLAYGSSLRGTALDDTLIDLYVLVSSYEAAHGGRIERLANRLLPPNVYYLEHAFDGRTLRAKVAVVSLEQFEHKLSLATSNPYFWARFAQPCALVHARDDTARTRTLNALAAAVETMLANAPALGDAADARALWVAVLQATYRTELRPESVSRAGQIVDADRAYYEGLAESARGQSAISGAPRRGAASVRRLWWRRRLAGKLLTVARLIKAGFTFQGGADYIAWKISRHSGIEVTVTPWQRRHPILAALLLAPRLYFRGGFR
ncbi:MAG: hypothetical protein ACR2PM_10670 [Hyphomicrobiales bacterium]